MQTLNFIPYTFAWMWLLINYLIAFLFRVQKKDCKFELNITSEFLKTRFNNSEVYNHIQNDRYNCYYRLYKESNVDVAYLMDFREGDKRTLRSLIYAIRNIMKKEDVAMILYVGTMNMPQIAMLKLPHRFDPKPLPLTVNILNKDKQILEDAESLTSWDFGLINFDAR